MDDIIAKMREINRRITIRLIDLGWKYTNKYGKPNYVKNYSDLPKYALHTAQKVKTSNPIYTSSDAPLISQYLAPEQNSHQNRVNIISQEISSHLQNKHIDENMLMIASLLHDILKTEKSHNHGKDSSKFLKVFKLLSDPDDEEVVSALIKYHSGTFIPDLSEYSKKQRKQIHAMLPILRMCDVLSRSDSDTIPLVFSQKGKIYPMGVKEHHLNNDRVKRLIKSIEYYNKHN